MMTFLRRIASKSYHLFCDVLYCFKLSIVLLKQYRYANRYLTGAKEIIVLFVPTYPINGGVMSIFGMADITRKLYPRRRVLISFYPKENGRRYFKNDNFPNDEVVLSWSLVKNSVFNADRVWLHIPECDTMRIYDQISKDDLYRLRRIPDLRINILDQNVDYMPSRSDLSKLYSITRNISQTTAHERYSTQAYADKFGLPTIWQSVYIKRSYRHLSFDRKQKWIAYSPDDHPKKTEVLDKIRAALPQYRLIEIKNLKYIKYLELIAECKYVITFGEGMDAYFSEPAHSGTISFAVYNDRFFPKQVDWKSLAQVFSSYDEMVTSIVDRIRFFDQNEELYQKCILSQVSFLERCYGRYEDRYNDVAAKIKRYYDSDFDYNPLTGCGNVTYEYKPDNWVQEEFLNSGGYTLVFLNYNKIEYIEKAVASTLAQDFPLLEIIFMDDNSNDGSGDVMESMVRAYKGRFKVTVVRNAENQRIAGQWNIAAKLATGNWLGMFCADDVQFVDRVSKIHKRISRYPALRGICTAVKMRDYLNGGEMKDHHYDPNPLTIRGDESDLRKVDLVVDGASSFWHKSLFDKPFPCVNLDDTLIRWILQAKCEGVKDVVFTWASDIFTVEYSRGTGITSKSVAVRNKNETPIQRWINDAKQSKSWFTLVEKAHQGVQRYYQDNGASRRLMAYSRFTELKARIFRGNTILRFSVIPGLIALMLNRHLANELKYDIVTTWFKKTALEMFGLGFAAFIKTKGYQH